MKRLKILPDVCEGLLGVCGVPLGGVLAVEVIVMIALHPMLKVYAIDIPLINVVDHWTKIASDAVKQDDEHQNQSAVC